MVKFKRRSVITARKHCVPMLLITLLTAALSPAFGDISQAPEMEPSQWGKLWEKNEQPNLINSQKFAIISRAAVVRKTGDAFVVIPVNPEEAIKQSFLQTPNEKELALAKEINRPMTGELYAKSSPVHPCERDLISVARCFRIDSLLDVTGTSWRLYRYMTNGKRLVPVLDAPAGGTQNYFEWIQAKLNYDGVILDSKDGFLLALLPNRPNSEDTQALTLQNSRNEVVLKSKSNKGTSLLQLYKSEGRFAIFKSVIAASANDEDVFSKGTKLIIEKAKK